MSQLPVSRQERRENSDPYELETPVPVAILVLVAAMVAFGMIYILTASLDGPAELGDNRTPSALMAKPAASEPAAREPALADGAAVYAARCAACHQANGQGLAGAFPPLAGSEWVTGDAMRLAKILLHGVQGPITVKGVTYNGAMPSFKDQLDDAAIAAVASYARSQWGNGAAPVAADAVAEARAQSTSRNTPWNGEAELAAMK